MLVIIIDTQKGEKAGLTDPHSGYPIYSTMRFSIIISKSDYAKLLPVCEEFNLYGQESDNINTRGAHKIMPSSAYPIG